MVGSNPPDPIVSVRSAPLAPTGQGTIYVTESGRQWQSTIHGTVTSGGTEGYVEGGGKFGPSHVRPIR